MSLDIAILDVDGRPERQISIGVDDHFKLVALIARRGLLSRLDDYYRDAEFLVSELDDLHGELLLLKNDGRTEGRSRALVEDLMGMVEEARLRKCSVVVIAD